MIAAVGLGCVGSPAGAVAAKALETGFSDGLFVSGDETARAKAFEEAVEARAGVARINLSWRGIVSGHPEDPRNPADPAYDFSAIDTAVSAADQRGLDVLITIYSAPDFAEGSNRPNGAAPGTWKPDPGAFGDFATAVASRYSGNFAGLPRVRYFQAWNEPNLSVYLTPQYKGGTRGRG